MKPLKYILAPIIFLGLINWSTDFTFVQIRDIPYVVIILTATLLLMALGNEKTSYKVRFRTSIMTVGLLLTFMAMYKGISSEGGIEAIHRLLMISVKPMLLCLVMYPPLSLIAEKVESKWPVKLEEEERSWEDMLSRREREIIELVRKDLSNSEIAEKLFISDLTVKKHVYNIMKKANVSKREDLL